MLQTVDTPGEEHDSSKSPSPEQKVVKRKRTLKACDPCRYKKLKCSGHHPCLGCSANDRNCTYSSRRRRDSKIWNYGTQEIVDEALQRLYQACKASSSFPGPLPTEDQDGHASTESILQALGLLPGPSFHRELMDRPSHSSMSQPGDHGHRQMSATFHQVEATVEINQTQPQDRHGSIEGSASVITSSSLQSSLPLDMCTQFSNALEANISMTQPAHQNMSQSFQYGPSSTKPQYHPSSANAVDANSAALDAQIHYHQFFSQGGPVDTDNDNTAIAMQHFDLNAWSFDGSLPNQDSVGTGTALGDMSGHYWVQ